jgi:hypothetical protein
MGELVLVTVATQKTGYSPPHITLLLRQGKVAGEKVGGVWLVDLDSLKQYEATMNELGPKKFDPTKHQS